MTIMTIVERLKSASEDPNIELGLVFIDRREKETHYTWKVVYDRALKAAGALKSRGFQKGDRIGIILPTGIEFMDAFFGAQHGWARSMSTKRAN